MRAPSGRAAQGEAMSDAAPPNGKTVLLVEDNPHNRKIFFGMLTHAGFRVVEATDGNQAMTKVISEKPDLVLMDLSIPGIDGWECTRRIKSDPGTRDLPVIALTAHAMRGDEERARAAGCDGYLSKPVSPKKVVEVVRKYLKME
jgi:two-component system, cell cycle response regulator DivK